MIQGVFPKRVRGKQPESHNSDLLIIFPRTLPQKIDLAHYLMTEQRRALGEEVFVVQFVRN
jgi:hypothetical protein